MFLIGFLSNAISIIVNSSYLALNNTKFILIKKIIIEIKVGKIICISSDFSHNNTGNTPALENFFICCFIFFHIKESISIYMPRYNKHIEMNVYYLLEQDFDKLIELQIIKDKKGVNLLKRYLEQIGQTSIVEEGNVNNNKEYDVKKREYDNNLTKKFRSTMLKDAAVKMQYKQSIEAQLDQ